MTTPGLGQSFVVVSDTTLVASSSQLVPFPVLANASLASLESQAVASSDED